MPVGHSNRWQGFLDLVLPMKTTKTSSASTSADLQLKYPFRRSILLHTKDIDESTYPVDINTLHNVIIVDELIKLTIESDAEIIANSHWIEDLARSSVQERLVKLCIKPKYLINGLISNCCSNQETLQISFYESLKRKTISEIDIIRYSRKLYSQNMLS